MEAVVVKRVDRKFNLFVALSIKGDKMAKLTEEQRDDILISMNETVKGLKKDMNDVKKVLEDKPDRDEVRQIVREELDNVFVKDTFKLTKVS